MAGGMALPSRHNHQSEGHRIVEDGIEGESVDVQPVVAVNEAEFAIVNDSALPLPKSLADDARRREET